MQELHVGKMTNQELADWFGVAKKTYQNQKVEKLEELKRYAKFECEWGGIDIKEVYEPHYIKGKTNYEKVRDEIDNMWNKNGLDTCKNVGMKIERKIGGDLSVVGTTVYEYTKKGRNELYGVPYKEPGTLGSCIYMLCKDTEHGLDFLTEEEQIIKDRIIKKYYGDINERVVIVDGMLAAGEITKEEYFDVLHQTDKMNDTTRYMTFLGELQTEIGCKIIKGTYKRTTKELVDEGFAWEVED